jgi:hypothetical protein
MLLIRSSGNRPFQFFWGYLWVYTMNLRLTLRFNHFLFSSDLSVYNWPIVANIFIRKSTLPILLKVRSSLHDELEIDLELWPVIVVDRVVIVPLIEKLEIVSAFSLDCRKKNCASSWFALQVELLQLAKVSHENLTLKSIFFEKIYKTKKILSLKMPRKKFSTR